MRKWMIVFLLVILILVDQGSKIIISQNYTTDPDVYMPISNTVHIHPYLHAEDAEKLTPLAEKLSLDVRVLLGLNFLLFLVGMVAVGFCVVFFFRFLFWDFSIKKHPNLIIAWFVFFAAGVLCSGFFDDLFWGGSLDFICFARDIQIPVNGHTHTVPRHRVYDLKDFYIIIGSVFLFLRAILFFLSALKGKREDTVSFDEKCKHPIQNIRNMRARSTDKKICKG